MAGTKPLRSQREFAQAMALVRAGRSDRDVAAQTRIPRRTISGWRRGERGVRSRPNSGSNEPCRHDFSALPNRDYAYLLGMYLGDGCISASHRPGVWCLRIACDSRYPGIIRTCRQAMDAVFPGKRANAAKRRHCNCVDVTMWSKHWPCLIPQHGPGRKHLRSIELTEWQEAIVTEQRRAFVKGLIESDGTRIIATERKGSYVRRAPRYAFSNRSEDIKRLFCESCDALGIRWTRPSDRQIAIYRLASVAILDEFVGPKR
jgi:hypothetical protein